jgi:hypothetical protein
MYMLLHGVHKIKAHCLSVRMFNHQKYSVEMDKIWYSGFTLKEVKNIKSVSWHILYIKFIT